MGTNTHPRYLDKYELHELLGRGGMAEVWKAWDSQLQRYVAIKLLHMDLQSDPDFLNRFAREARVIASLRHPNIVQIHDFQTTTSLENSGPFAYMVMDYIDGPTLAEYIRRTSRKGHFPTGQELVDIFAAISRAVDYAHTHNMVHRDIKPANILLDKRNTTHLAAGEPILTDFGIARLTGASTGTLSHTWMGTPLYLSPEQAQGQPGSGQSDIYSLGVILYEICTGTQPFRGETVPAILLQQISAQPTPPEQLNPQVTPALAAVIKRCLAKEPGERYHSASSMTIALAEALYQPIPTDFYPSSTTRRNQGEVLFSSPTTPGPWQQPQLPPQARSRPTSLPLIARLSVPLSAGPPQQAPTEWMPPGSPMLASPPMQATPGQSVGGIGPPVRNPITPPPEGAAFSTPPAQAGFTPPLEGAAFSTPPPAQASLTPSQVANATPLTSAQPAPGTTSPQAGLVSPPIPPAAQPTPLLANWETPQQQQRATPITPPVTPTFAPGEKPATSPPAMKPMQRLPERIDLLRMQHAWLFPALLAALALIVFGSSIGGIYALTHQASPGAGNSSVGRVFFVNSGAISEHNNTGENDGVVVDLHNIQNPDQGKAYYAWLVSNTKSSDIAPLPLGKVNVQNGDIHLQYFNPDHTNLLSLASGFLLTQEDASNVPAAPTTDQTAWRYSASLPSTPDPQSAEHFSVVDHLRHLLAQDPKLFAHQLPGGLDIWLFRNTEKVLEWSGSARDFWEQKNTDGLRNQVIRVLDYLDGSQYVQLDVPPGTPNLVNPRIAPVALLEFDPTKQQPPGYLYHINVHLHGIVSAPGATAEQSTLAEQIDIDLNNAKSWLQQVRQDARQLIGMSDAALLSNNGLTLLDDMETNARYAYVGKLDPTNNQTQGGVTQIYYNSQALTTMSVTANDG